MIKSNQIKSPFFYLQGGCKPLNQIKGFDKMLLSMFVGMLKKSEQNQETIKTIDNIQNGYDGVKEENLAPIMEWIKSL